MSILAKNNTKILKFFNNTWWSNKIYINFLKKINIKYYFWIIFNYFQTKNNLQSLNIYCFFTGRAKATFKAYFLSRLFLKESFDNNLYPTIYKGFF